MTNVATKFFAKEFWTPKVNDRVEEVHIKFIKMSKLSDAVAMCDYEIDPGFHPSCFTVEFNNTKYQDIKPNWYLRTLFHELVHVGQFALGQLRSTDKNWYWKSKKYPDFGTDAINYWKMPWEVEAYGTEICAYKLFEETFPAYGLNRFKPQYNGRAKLPIKQAHTSP